MSAGTGYGGPLGTKAGVIASSVHSVLVHLGDGGALGALSDLLVSVESLLIDVLPLLSLEARLLVSSVPMVDKESGLLPDVHCHLPHCSQHSSQYQAHCHCPPVTALWSPCIWLVVHSLVQESTDR